jgi:rubrerythrin
MSNERSGRFDHLQQILDYAIGKEQEAAEFYTDLAAKVVTGSLAAELRKIAAMEMHHKERLQHLDLAGATTQTAPVALDLQIADYLVEQKPGPEMAWQEILNIAMHQELAAMKLYADLANRTDDPAGKLLFLNLAAEESNHKLYFERIWDEEVLLEN